VQLGKTSLSRQLKSILIVLLFKDIYMTLQDPGRLQRRSYQITFSLYTIGNTLTYMDEGECQELNLSPETFFIEAAKVFENLILDEYEKLGTPKNSLSVIILLTQLRLTSTTSESGSQLLIVATLRN